MTQRMTRKNDFDWVHFIAIVKKRHKKKFGKPITATEIRKIIKTYLNWIIEKVIEGGQVRMDRHSTIEVIGVPVLEDKIFKILVKGKSIRRDGSIKNAEFGSKRRDFKYKITYRNKLNEDLHFNADQKFAKRVHEAIENTNNYYKICQSIN